MINTTTVINSIPIKLPLSPIIINGKNSFGVKKSEMLKLLHERFRQENKTDIAVECPHCKKSEWSLTFIELNGNITLDDKGEIRWHSFTSHWTNKCRKRYTNAINETSFSSSSSSSSSAPVPAPPPQPYFSSSPLSSSSSSAAAAHPSSSFSPSRVPTVSYQANRDNVESASSSSSSWGPHAGILNNRANIDFYSNIRPATPRVETIDQIHQQWIGQYEILQDNDHYIQSANTYLNRYFVYLSAHFAYRLFLHLLFVLFFFLFFFFFLFYDRWLFPNQDIGQNGFAQPLYKHEIEEFHSSNTFRDRLIKSYELMLDFYGMRLSNRESGEIVRNQDNYKARYYLLNNSNRSHRCITRILVCLGKLYLEHYQLPLLEHILHEVKEGLLRADTVGESLRNYWIPTLNAEDCVSICLLMEHN
jgi:hypothetical protein